jgi:hypothetical protein
MATPDDLKKAYPLESWLDDFDIWGPQAPLSPQDVPRVMAFFHQKYAGNPLCDAMASYFWNGLMLFASLAPGIFEAGLCETDSSGDIRVPTAVQSAFYRVTMFYPEAAWRHRIDIPLLKAVTKDQRDFNEDRS